MNEYSVYISGNKGSDFFPDRFSNKIYFSDNAKVYMEYKTVYSIKYQISGIENYKIGNKIHQILPNRYLVVNTDQDVICLMGNSDKAISIFIEPELLKDVFENCKKCDEELLSNPFDFCNQNVSFFENCYLLNDNRISSLLKRYSELFGERKTGQISFELNNFFTISEALIHSQQETFKQIKNIECVKRSTKSELYKRMLKARDYIFDNWSKNISVVLLARLVCMSPFHFHRTFSSVFGITSSQYHKHIKMLKAKELITENNYSISQIAVLIGYENIQSFSKAFKNHFGVSPSKYTIGQRYY